MKKLIALLVVAIMALSCMGAFAEYDTPVSFTVCTTQTQAAGDYSSDPLARYVQEKFNVNYEVWPIAFDSQDEKVRVWINSESMPTMTTWMNWGYSEYLDYVDQGLLGALPEGWEMDYPNLYKMIEASGIMDYLTVDGEIYAIPHSVFANFCDIDTYTSHNMVFYRKDWANQLGYEFGDTATMSEFKAFLQECIEKDMSGTGATQGLVATKDYLNNLFMNMTGIDYDGFVEEADHMEWGPNYQVVADQIGVMRQWYQDGVIHPDYYLLATTEANEYFNIGGCAAIYRDGVVGAYYECIDELKENGIENSEVAPVMLTADDGVLRTLECTNYWSITVFNPENDAETMARVLALTDWLCSAEGQIICQMGVPGVEWDYDAEGNPAYLEAALDENGEVVSQWDRNTSFRIWRQLGILSDDFNFVSPFYPAEIQEQILNLYNVRAEGEVIPYNFNYGFFASETKNIYSVDILGAVTELVIGDADIATAWQQFIDNNSGMWKPLLDELNAEYFG